MTSILDSNEKVAFDLTARELTDIARDELCQSCKLRHDCITNDLVCDVYMLAIGGAILCGSED